MPGDRPRLVGRRRGGFEAAATVRPTSLVLTVRTAKVRATEEVARMTLQMWTATLQKARTAWEEQSEGLNGPRKNLAQADPALLGDAVQGAADAFLTTWEQRTLVLRDQASGHADSLAQTMYDFLATDAESVQATQQLLLWEDRDTLPVQAVGP